MTEFPNPRTNRYGKQAPGSLYKKGSRWGTGLLVGSVCICYLGKGCG